MQELRLVAVSEDGTYLVLATAGRGTRFTLPVDDRLRAAVRGNFSRLGQYEIEVESPLRPKEIQARIRAGETAEEIAATAGIPVERVRWFEGPVLQEREYMAQQAQRVPVRLPGEATPGPTLGELVAERLTRRGVPADEIDWDSCKRDDNLWRVKLGFVWNGHTRHAEWLFDPRRRHITPNDDEAMRLSAADYVEPVTERAKEEDATVRPFVPRLAPKPAPKLASVPSLPADPPRAAQPEPSVRHEPAVRREPPAAWQHEPVVRPEPRTEPPAAFRPDLTPVPFRLPDPLADLDVPAAKDHDADGRDSHGHASHGRAGAADRGNPVIGLPAVAPADRSAEAVHEAVSEVNAATAVDHTVVSTAVSAASTSEAPVHLPDPTSKPATATSKPAAAEPDPATTQPPTAADLTATADPIATREPVTTTEPVTTAGPVTTERPTTVDTSAATDTEAASEKDEPTVPAPVASAEAAPDAAVSPSEAPTPAADTTAAERAAEPVAENRTPEVTPATADVPATGKPVSSDPVEKTSATTTAGTDKAGTDGPAPAAEPGVAAAVTTPAATNPAAARPAVPSGAPPRPKPRPRPTVPAARPASDAPAASAAAAGTDAVQKQGAAADATPELTPPVPKPRPRKSRRRASVPTWDEIMFGARKPD
ncbi:hypothetical protein Mth01_16380 [Sphaerimonospora thailandensis]|uniref:DUF3071 domain-containing protein n=1 Tax=Sphaerimonospora thailandensis TaxID=795644 RepID=A0A8J3R6R4_9ACTN|nr:septation protein SepH [Sphaerimonospora thailandensis]GIH69385.1 hypothetical protein Mth01_16380 [Sphaerimonospora thailandensis]